MKTSGQRPQMGWVIDSDGEPIVVLPASELVELIAGNPVVCEECASAIAKDAEVLLPHPWRELVDGYLHEDAEDREGYAS